MTGLWVQELTCRGDDSTLDTSNDPYGICLGLWVQVLNFKGDDLDPGY